MLTSAPILLAWVERAAAYGLASWVVQATLLLFAGLLLSRLPRLRPAHRHAVLLTALCLAALSPLGLVVPSSLRIQAAVPAGLPAAGAARQIVAKLSGPPPRGHANAAATYGRAGSTVPPLKLWGWIQSYPALALWALWCVVVGVRLGLLLISAAQVASWVRRGRPLDRDRLYAACGYRVADLPVLETPAVQVPSVVGVWRPVILLPLELAGRIEADALGHVLFHEEGHARRRDPLLRLVAALSETLLCWHPLVPLVRHQLETAAEDACDTHALERGSARTAYARTLLSVLELALASRSRPLACRLGKRGSELKRRVTRILTGAPDSSPALGYFSLAALVPALGASALLEVGPRPENPLGPSGLQVRRSSGGQVFRSSGPRAVRPSGPRAPEHPNTRTPDPLNTPTPDPLTTAGPPATFAIKPGTWRALPGSVLVEEGDGVPGGSRDVLPRRDHLTVFLLDISGPLTAQQLEARRQIMLRIQALPAGDRFNVVAFNSRVLPYASSPVAPSTESIASVRSWMEVLPHEPGSGVAEGLRHALAHEGVTSVIFFADGDIARDISARPELVTVLARENRSHARILAVAPEIRAPQQQRIGPAVFDLMPEPLQSDIRATDRPGGVELP